MFGTVFLLALAAGVWWLWWRHQHPPQLHGCPLCPERVRDVAAHLTAAHPDTRLDCKACGRSVPADVKASHWRLFHTPRPRGPEDRHDWKAER